MSLTEALRELEFYQGRWLLLFDGADSLEEISDLFPPGRYGDIVYTSRNLCCEDSLHLKCGTSRK